jgi:heterodisulfide reductase subunit A
MKTGVYFCNCGTNISEKIDSDIVRDRVSKSDDQIHFKAIDFMCSEEGKELLKKNIKENKIDRVVISACSPRDHENTFMRILSDVGLNPYLMQMVNTREQVAWVTEDRINATEKTARYIIAAIKRVMLHDPLEKKEIDICPDVLVIGAGPAGLKTALSIAESGRKVVIVEKTPVIGGMPVRYEELFPSLECGPCMLEPLLGDILHGEHSNNIEILTLSEVIDVVGSYGNFAVKIRQHPRYVDVNKCVGCAECIEPCPVSRKNEFNYGLNNRKAISFPFAGALPNVPSIDNKICLRIKAARITPSLTLPPRGGGMGGGVSLEQSCNLCKDACPVEDAIVFDDTEKIIERNVGAVVLAIGSGIYDCKKIPNLGYGLIPDIYTGTEFERILASNGPTEGKIVTTKKKSPKTVAIIHCVGSLDKDHKEYCSGICCQYAFKFSHLIGKKLPGTKIYHFYKELSIPGKDEFSLYDHVKNNPNAKFVRYENVKDLNVKIQNSKKAIRFKDITGKRGSVYADMIILCPAVIPIEESAGLGVVFEITQDKSGFFEELHGRMDSSASKIKGIYLAGTCQSPMDIQKAMGQGMAAAGYILSGLVAGRKLEIKPVNAVIDSERCSGCRVCVSVCPYSAISFDKEKEISVVNDVLCQGCGTCVSACPSGVITGRHFTNEEIIAEIEGVLA